MPPDIDLRQAEDATLAALGLAFVGFGSIDLEGPVRLKHEVPDGPLKQAAVRVMHETHVVEILASFDHDGIRTNNVIDIVCASDFIANVGSLAKTLSREEGGVPNIEWTQKAVDVGYVFGPGGQHRAEASVRYKHLLLKRIVDAEKELEALRAPLAFPPEDAEVASVEARIAKMKKVLTVAGRWTLAVYAEGVYPLLLCVTRSQLTPPALQRPWSWPASTDPRCSCWDPTTCFRAGSPTPRSSWSTLSGRWRGSGWNRTGTCSWARSGSATLSC